MVQQRRQEAGSAEGGGGHEDDEFGRAEGALIGGVEGFADGCIVGHLQRQLVLRGLAPDAK
jgi:hypothetical protein